ncbi:MAG: hypothetical protein AB2L24_13235 [Mangrovibacterium sp.]
MKAHPFLIHKHFILPLVVGIGQFSGINIYYLSLILVSLLITVETRFQKNSFTDHLYLLIFILYSLVISLVNLSFKLPDLYSALMWMQFFFISAIPLLIQERAKLLRSFLTIVHLIFILDFITNLILLLNIEIPWADRPRIRPGESFPRLPGVMNNSLFSGYLSFLVMCFLLDKSTWKQNRLFKIFYIPIVLMNILFSGANRIFILILTIAVVRFVPVIRRSRVLLSGSILFVITITVLLTFYTALTNQSNFYRSQLWIMTTERISQKPILGYGIFYPDSSAAKPDLNVLAKMGVTESFILSIAYSFGLFSLIFFLVFMFSTFFALGKLPDYTFPQGIFLGLSIELFFGGSLANTLFTFLYFLSFYVIIDDCKNQTDETQEFLPA